MNLIKLQRFPLNPLAGLGRLANFHNDLESLLSTVTENASGSWVPALDIFEEKDNYLVKVELPGVNKDDVSLSLEKGTLTIGGERKAENTNESTELYYRERPHGRFQRSINLPESVSADKVTAQFKDGVLTVTLPKNEAAKPRQINIVPS
jgi:HSP20 family protein